MKMYTINDLEIISDPIGLIQRNPSMFLRGRERAFGEDLATRMLSDLIWSGVLPAHVGRVGPWWEISSPTDWLARDGIGIEAFGRIVPFPIAGPDSHRCEILLAAFAEVVVTSGSDGIHWIKGDRSRVLLPEGLNLHGTHGGRVLLFRM
jgi:hypothetical protein